MPKSRKKINFSHHRFIETSRRYAVICAGSEIVLVPPFPAKVVDTTSAGDTFIGYLFAGLLEGMTLREAMTLASRASAITVSRAGAADSIPFRRELEA
jgi:ribokinase